jgi:hypothetical protein
MPMSNHPKLASPVVQTHHCSHLRHKGMYVMAAPDPDEFRFYDRFDATAFWCACTQRGVGPDRQPVDASRCTGARACCEH